MTYLFNLIYLISRRIGSCDTKDELKKPGWAQTTEGKGFLKCLFFF